jgi:hypothetical protein
MDERTLMPVKPGTGMIVAVKKLKLDSFQGHREWLVGAFHSEPKTEWLNLQQDKDCFNLFL